MENYKVSSYKEMEKLQQRSSETFSQEHAQFKSCKGSEKIVKSLFKKEKEYTVPVHERLYHQKATKSTNLQEIVEKANLKGKYLTSNKNESNVKNTTELSRTIEIHRRIGTDTLLSEKDYNKLSALKKVGKEKKTRIELEEIDQQNIRRKRDATMNKSKLSTKSKLINQSALSQRAMTRTSNKPSQRNNPTKVKSSKNSNKYLYTKLCSEIDENISRILKANPECEVLVKNNIRIILVK